MLFGWFIQKTNRPSNKQTRKTHPIFFQNPAFPRPPLPRKPPLVLLQHSRITTPSRTFRHLLISHFAPKFIDIIRGIFPKTRRSRIFARDTPNFSRRYSDDCPSFLCHDRDATESPSAGRGRCGIFWFFGVTSRAAIGRARGKSERRFLRERWLWGLHVLETVQKPRSLIINMSE